jgi:hypothetical protein
MHPESLIDKQVSAATLLDLLFHGVDLFVKNN